MKSIIRTIGLPLLLGFLFLATYLIYYLGAWRSVEVSHSMQPEMHLLYVEHRGAYHKIATRIEEVERWARDNGVKCDRTFGEYLDDPLVVDEDRLRSHAGCVLNEPIQAADGYEFRTEPAQNYISAEFHGSPAIGPWKVYPKMTEYAESHRLRRATRVFEVYTLEPNGNMSTLYLWPVE